MLKHHIDDKHLEEHLKNLREEMTWRRELEFRLLQLPLVLYSVIGTAMVALFQSDVSPTVFGIVVAVASALIIYISRFICNRIRDEHFSYEELGGQVQQIWTHYGFFKPSAYIKGNTILPTRLNEPGKGYGQGQGYKKTIKLIWSISVSLILTLLALSVIRSL